MEKEWPYNVIVEVAKEFRKTLAYQRTYIQDYIARWDSDEFRERFAREDPLFAKAVEASTSEERVQRGEELAFSLAIAYSIVSTITDWDRLQHIGLRP